MKLKLKRSYNIRGSIMPAGEVVTTNDITGRWLIDNGIAVETKARGGKKKAALQEPAPEQEKDE